MDHNSIDINRLPSAIEEIEHLKILFKQKKPVIFLDYDGTLTPIVPNPAQALLSSEMREVLTELSSYCYTIVVSGRDRQDVKNKVGLNNLYYAGSHGFDISGPEQLKMEHTRARDLLPEFEEVESLLSERLKSFEKVQVERKKYAIAVHYRNARDEDVDKIKREVEKVLNGHPNLKEGPGKKIVELKPNMDWNKGKAVLWIMRKLKVSNDAHIPVYIGDDITDEDAFKVLKETGIGILVGNHGSSTKANYSLQNVDEVVLWLQKIIACLKGYDNND